LASGSLIPEALSVAVDPRRGLIVGAGTFVPEAVDSERPGCAVAVTVVPSYRRRGLGRQLVRAVARDAASWNIPFLHSAESVDEGSPLAAFYGASGFARHHLIRTFESTTQSVVDYLVPTCKRTAAKGRVPADAQLWPLLALPEERLVSFWARIFCGSIRRAQLLIRKSRSDSITAAASQGLTVNDRAVGLALWEPTESARTYVLSGWAVEPRYRGGWAPIHLLSAAMQQMAAMGGRVVRYECNETVRKTLNMAASTGGQLLRTRWSYTRGVS
jgi:ribosomal protein S18 acetylase RimI-like enzyme